MVSKECSGRKGHAEVSAECLRKMVVGGYCFRGDPRGMRKWKSGEDRPSSCAVSGSKLRGR